MKIWIRYPNYFSLWFNNDVRFLFYSLCRKHFAFLCNIYFANIATQRLLTRSKLWGSTTVSIKMFSRCLYKINLSWNLIMESYEMTLSLSNRYGSLDGNYCFFSFSKRYIWMKFPRIIDKIDFCKAIYLNQLTWNENTWNQKFRINSFISGSSISYENV